MSLLEAAEARRLSGEAARQLASERSRYEEAKSQRAMGAEAMYLRHTMEIIEQRVKEAIDEGATYAVITNCVRQMATEPAIRRLLDPGGYSLSRIGRCSADPDYLAVSWAD